MIAPPADPRVRAFLEALAVAVAEHVLRELARDQAEPETDGERINSEAC